MMVPKVAKYALSHVIALKTDVNKMTKVQQIAVVVDRLYSIESCR